MKVKICGLNIERQILELDNNCDADYLGFIFFEGSKRRYDKAPVSLPNKIKVGVFVDAEIGFIQRHIEQHHLDVIQLHGHESPEFCRELSQLTDVIKAFGIQSFEDLNHLKRYEGTVRYFLLDTKTSLHGGSGLKFDWSILQHYPSETPFFLSGGISPDDAKIIRELSLPNLFGIDINSRFEINPGNKDLTKIEHFIKELKHEKSI